MKKSETRSYKAGQLMANAIIEFIHLMYQKNTASKVLLGLLNTFEMRKKEFE